MGFDGQFKNDTSLSRSRSLSLLKMGKSLFREREREVESVRGPNEQVTLSISL